MTATNGIVYALWKAEPHAWGEGKVHGWDHSRDRTICGRTKNATPGEFVSPDDHKVTCGSCHHKLDADARRAQQQAEWAERRREREEEQRQWWARYDAYLNSEAWARKRRLVLKRAQGICEGCGQRPATQVHHTTYEHAFNEMLWELVAVCEPCHLIVTELDRVRRGAS